MHPPRPHMTVYAGKRFSYEIPITPSFYSSRFFMAISPFVGCGRMSLIKSDSRRTGVMTFDPNHDEHLRELQQELHRAHTITPRLMAAVIARACPRLQAQQLAARTTVIRLIESGAFADAALALLDLELPQWKLRRLIREDDEWHCSLSKQLGLPAEFDEM